MSDELDPIVAKFVTRVKASPKTQGQIAREMHISQGYLSEVVHGRKIPSMPMLRQMLKYFGMELRADWIIPIVATPPRRYAEGGTVMATQGAVLMNIAECGMPERIEALANA